MSLHCRDHRTTKCRTAYTLTINMRVLVVGELIEADDSISLR